jgi:hypothetical protein
MKNLSFKLFLILFLCSLPHISYGGNTLDRGLESLTNSVIWVKKLAKALRDIDDDNNKQKARDMAARLTIDVNDIINAKRRMILKLESADQNVSLQSELNNIRKEVEELDSTFHKYEPLIRQVNMDIISWRQNFYMDLLDKQQTINDAQGLLNGNASKEQVRKELINYFKKGIKQLEKAQKHLNKIARI